MTSASKTAASPNAKLNTQNSIFIPISQAKPPKSNENISPGNFTNPHEAIVINVSPTKLFFKNIQETNVYVSIGKIITSAIIPPSTFCMAAYIMPDIKIMVAIIEEYM